MILPVKAPAAAPAAAPIDAARTLPVAAPPMIAPVAAPHAAPCPTGVSHDVRMQQLNAISELTVGIALRIIHFWFMTLNRTPRQMLRERPQHSLCLAEPILGVYKYFLCTYVED